MFTNFEKAFFKNNQVQKKLPKEIIDSLNEKLPDGYKYTDIGNGAVGITPETGKITLGGFKAILPEDLPEKFKPTSYKELTEYMYRTQQSLKLKTNNDMVTINDISFKIDEMIDFPLSEKKESSYEVVMKPQPFQGPFEIEIEGNDIKKKVSIQRQPYADMEKSLFKSVKENSFDISYLLDEVNLTLKFTFNLNLDKAKSTPEVLEALKLYNSCLQGTISINGAVLPESSVVESEEESIVETIRLWEKVLDLENALHVVFIPQSQIEYEDVTLIEEMYRSFIEKKPFKEYIKINSLVLNGYKGENINDLLNIEGLSFQFLNKMDVKLLGVDLEFFSIVTFYDFIVTSIEPSLDDKNKSKLLVKNSNGKKIYQVVQYFSTEKDAFNFRDETEINELQNAEIIKF